MENHGICMGWHNYGICMEDGWNMYGTCMEYLLEYGLNMHEICIEHVEYVWDIDGICD